MASTTELAIVIAAKDMASGVLGKVNQALGGLGSAAAGLATAGLAGLATAGVGLAAGLGSSIAAAADFEAAMSAVQAVAGATDQQFKALSDAALALGQDNTLAGVGATDAAKAMRELAAAGVSVTDIVGGAARGALLLASAGGLDVARAAEIAANAMSMFGKSGGDVAHIADLFSAAANASAISVDDIGESMKYIGPIAQSMGISIEEVTAALAELGAQGIKGSQAGTSLRSIMVSLASPSKEASKIIKDLGLQFFDAQGHMKSIAGVSEELKTKLARLNDQQRASALATLFGNEALTAAQVLYGQGAAGIAKYLDEVNQAGSAAQAGATRNNNLRGSLESLKSAFETAQIALGQAFLPTLKMLADRAATAVSAAIPLIQAWGPLLAAGVGQALAVIGQLARYIGSSVGAIVGAWQQLQAGNITLAQFIGGIKQMITTVLGDVGGLLSAVGQFLAPFGQALVGFIKAAIPVVASELLILAQHFGNWVSETAIPWLLAQLPGWWTALSGWVMGTALPAVGGLFVTIGQAFGNWVTETAIPYMQANLPLWWAALSDWVTGTAVPAAQTTLAQLGQAMGAWITETAIPFLQANLPLWLQALSDWITGTAIPAVQATALQLAQALSDWVSQAIPALGQRLSEWVAQLTGFLQALPAQIETNLIPAAQELGYWIGKHGIPALLEKFDQWKGELLKLLLLAPVWMEVALIALGKKLGEWIMTTGWPAAQQAWDTWGRNLMVAIGRLEIEIVRLMVAFGVSIMTGLRDSILTWIGNMMAAGQQIANAIIDGIAGALRAGIGKVMAAASALANAIPEPIRNLLGIHSPSRVMAEIGRDVVSGLIVGMDDKAQEAAKKAADVSSAVAKAIIDGLAAIRALAGFNGVGPSGAQVGAFRASITALIATFQDAAKEFNDKGLKAASDFADAAGKVGGSIKNAVEGLAALAAADWAKSSPTGSAMGWFTHLIGSLIENFRRAGDEFTGDALKVAAEFADAAGKVGGSVKNAVEGLKALATADWADTSPSGSAMGWFTHLIASLVENFRQAAQAFTTEGLKAASDLADAVGKVGGSIGNAVAGLGVLATFVTPSQANVDAFLTAVFYVVKRFQAAASTMATEGVKALGDYADAAGKALNAAKTAADFFGTIVKKDFIVPSKERIDQVLVAVRYTVQAFGLMAQELAGKGLQSANQVAEAAGKVFGATKTAADLFKNMTEKGFAIPAKEAIDALLGAVGYLIQQTRAVATAIGGEGMAQALLFAQSAQQVFATLVATLKLFEQLKDFQEIPTKMIQAMIGAINVAVGEAGRAGERANALLTAAITFRDTMLAAAQAFAEGLAAGDAIRVPSLPSIPNIGGGARSVTNNFTFTRPAIGDAQIQSLVVGALDEAGRRGRA